MKKLLAIGMVAAMFFTSVPVNAADLTEVETDAVIAETSVNEAVDDSKYKDIVGADYEEDINRIIETGLMIGYPDGTFRPKEKVSRSEFVVILTRLMSVSHIAQTMDAKSVFADVGKEFWASREIQLISDKNIINGYGDNTFRPDDQISYSQAVKLIVESLGYGKIAREKGGWPLGYLMVAEEFNVIDGISMDLEAAITRSEAAKLLNNALKVKKSDGTYFEDTMGEMYFYVSPNGDDKNPGTEEKPWKTAYKATKTAIAGTTVIFEDGEYKENVISMVEHSGEEGKPITFRARNKHKALINYSASLQAKEKWQVMQKSYINVRDLSFTQEKRATDSTQSATADIFLNARNAQHIEFTGNKCTNIYEEGIKLTYVVYFLLDGNEVIDSNHEGFDIFCCSNGVVRNNQLIDSGRVGLMMKGNSYNNIMYNNYLYFSKPMDNSTSHGIGLGGSSNNINPRDIGRNTGFEAYNCIAFNNLIVSEPGILPIGIAFVSSIDCHAYNNVVIGVDNAVSTVGTSATQKGWDWDVPIVNPTVKNNIFMNCENGVWYHTTPTNMVFENNIYYGIDKGLDKNAIVADPKLVDIKNKDYHLSDDSPAIDTGSVIPSEIPALNRSLNGEPIEKSIKIPMIDYDGKPRTGAWDIGIYSAEK